MVFIDPQAGCIAKHRKLVPTAGERLAWGQGDSYIMASLISCLLAT